MCWHGLTQVTPEPSIYLASAGLHRILSPFCTRRRWRREGPMVCFYTFTYCAQPSSLRTSLRFTCSALGSEIMFCSRCHALHVLSYSVIGIACRVALDAMAHQYPNAKVRPRRSLPLNQGLPAPHARLTANHISQLWVTSHMDCMCSDSCLRFLHLLADPSAVMLLLPTDSKRKAHFCVDSYDKPALNADIHLHRSPD